MKNFRTYELAMKLYSEVQGIKAPKRHVQDQLDRAALSICLNLAEGCGRATSKDRKRHYVIAFGSLRETQCLLRLLNLTGTLALSDQLAGSLYKLIQNPGNLC